ncbi:MAG: endonuclease domain-containing protein [Cardiobacteriaceae bacterium]|nr:endonuclease domain-containing protein [Cardiobacteriaceae bacterium]
MSRANRDPGLHAFARTMRQNMTDAEQCLWRALRHKQLSGIKFRRQQVIGAYIVDFVSMTHKLVIELDGGQHASQQHYDAQRSAFLHSQGYRVLRFWNHEVLQQTDAVVESILQHCQTPPPNPPPQAGEG